MKASELVDLIKEKCKDSVFGEKWEEFLYNSRNGQTFCIDDKISLECVDLHSSYCPEGEENIEIVLRTWTPLMGNQYFEIVGYYSSWDGGSMAWEDMYEVAPRDKSITVYEKV